MKAWKQEIKATEGPRAMSWPHGCAHVPWTSRHPEVSPNAPKRFTKYARTGAAAFLATGSCRVGTLRGAALPERSPGSRPHCCLSSRTLVTGAVGSLLLDWYGWPSVFYFSGGLTLLWVCYVYRYLLSEKGNRGWAGDCQQTQLPREGRGPGAQHPQRLPNVRPPLLQSSARSAGPWAAARPCPENHPLEPEEDASPPAGSAWVQD